MDQSCEITVFYTLHKSEKKSPDFPSQSFPSDRFQILPVMESEIDHPRMQSLQRLEEAQGAYTIFLDVGDRFPEKFLEQMLDLAKKDGSAFVMPFSERSFADTTYVLPPLKKTLTLNANENPIEFPTDLHGLLIRTDLLKEAVRNLKNSVEEEKQILLYLLAKNPVFSYLGSCTLHYVFPKEKDHQYDPRTLEKKWYFEPFEQFLLPVLKQSRTEKQDVPLFLQQLAIYMIQIRFTANRDNSNKYALEKEEVTDFTDLCSRALDYVSEAAILDTSIHPNAAQPIFLLLLLRLKKRDWVWYPEQKCTDDTVCLTCSGIPFQKLDELFLYVSLIDYRNGHLEIDGSYPDFFPEDTHVFVRFGPKDYGLTYNDRYSLTKFFGVTFFRKKTFHVSVPVPDTEVLKGSDGGEFLLNFYLQPKGGKPYRMFYNFSSHTSRFANCFTAGYWRFGNYFSFWDKDGIHVQPTGKLKVLKKELQLWGQMAKNPSLRKYLALKIPNFLLRPWFSRQRIWLFMDKIYKGGDSSEYLYKYSMKQKDGVKKYYLLDPSSSDYARLKKEGYHPLKRGSLAHRLIFLNADIVIASNSTVFAFNSYSTDTSQAIRGDIHFDVACVQHGMSVQKIAVAQNRLRDNTKLYFCASKYEIQNLSKPVYDYQGYDILKLTGVPRYDGLKNNTQKIILLSPTWRMNSVLPATHGESVARSYNPHFKETDYYRIYNGLINDPRLLQAAKKYGYRIQYVLHPLISPQEKDFVRNDTVEIIPSIGDTNYEKLFSEAALMVTDYSGVQFDFAYLRKPVVYLHHRDIPQHYEEGTFFYDSMGFGEICSTCGELIDVLCDYMKNDCRMPDKYRQRADDFFAFSDNHNCERIYPILLSHQP